MAKRETETIVVSDIPPEAYIDAGVLDLQECYGHTLHAGVLPEQLRLAANRLTAARVEQGE